MKLQNVPGAQIVIIPQSIRINASHAINHTGHVFFSVVVFVSVWIGWVWVLIAGVAGWATGVAGWATGVAGWATGAAGWATGVSGWVTGAGCASGVGWTWFWSCVCVSGVSAI